MVDLFFFVLCLILQQDVEKFTDIEKLYLYLKLPSGPSSGNDKRYAPPPAPTRSTQVHYFALWPGFVTVTHIIVLLLVRKCTGHDPHRSIWTQYRAQKCFFKKNKCIWILCFFLHRICFPALWLIMSMKQAADLCRRSAIPSCLCVICFPISIHHTHPSSTPPPNSAHLDWECQGVVHSWIMVLKFLF